jgi:glycine cleavage system H lipoate-binding protein
MSTPNTNKSLSDIFDVELTNTDKSLDQLKIAATVESIDTLETQREYVKKNIIELIEKGNLALDEMLTIAKSTEAGKDYMVATGMIKTLVETNTTLLDCEVAHKTTLNTPLTNNAEQITNNTAVFVGSTSELSKYLKDAAMNVNIPKTIID